MVVWGSSVVVLRLLGLSRGRTCWRWGRAAMRAGRGGMSVSAVLVLGLLFSGGVGGEVRGVGGEVRGAGGEVRGVGVPAMAVGVVMACRGMVMVSVVWFRERCPATRCMLREMQVRPWARVRVGLIMPGGVSVLELCRVWRMAGLVMVMVVVMNVMVVTAGLEVCWSLPSTCRWRMHAIPSMTMTMRVGVGRRPHWHDACPGFWRCPGIGFQVAAGVVVRGCVTNRTRALGTAREGLL